MADPQTRVLVADDDPGFRQVLKKWLQDWGYSVILADDGTQAWTILQQSHPPELVILDWVMPEITGIELCRRIRQQQQDLYQYVLLATGKDETQHLVEGFNAGADDYLVKPLVADELRVRLNAGKRILDLQRDLIHSRDELRFQATHDAQTGVLNRRALLEIFENETDRATRTHRPTGLLMIGLDHFQQVNDTYGQFVGDSILRDSAHRMTLAVRSYDIVGRYDGEKFLIVLPGCNMEQTRLSAERIRGAIASLPFRIGDESISITTSIGATVADPLDPVQKDILTIAGDALYQARQSGRNCTVILKAGGDVQLI